MKFTYLKNTAVALILSLAALSGSAQATLINTDFADPGDGLLVLDTDTGLEWATIVDNMTSVDLFNTQSIFANQGFTVATMQDLVTLFTNAGAVTLNLGINNDINNVPAVQNIRTLFNHTSPYTHTGGNPWIHGLFDNGNGGYDTARVGADYYDNTGSLSFTLGNNNFINEDSGYSHPAISIWAFRTAQSSVDVSEPSMMALIALAGAGLISFRRKQKAK